MRTFKFYFLRKFKLFNIVLLAYIVKMIYISVSDLIYLTVENLYP